MNRVGDMGLSIGFFAIFALFGSVDYATVFSIAPFMNETAITIIGLLLLSGAMAKSAQIPLHSWLPGSMEGFKETKFPCLALPLSQGKGYFLIIIYFIYCYFYSDNSYDIKYLSIIPIFNSIPDSMLHTMTGNMLGDGSISLSRFDKGEGKYAMTMDVYSLNYLNYLNENIYSKITSTKLHAYPNILLPQHIGKEIKQYHFSTKTHPLFTALHSLWYKWDDAKNKFIKIVPLNISEMFSSISLAY
jgi:hypothetical protein